MHASKRKFTISNAQLPTHMRITIVFVLSLTSSVALAQFDSTAIPREFAFRPAIRGGYLEATTFLYFGASGVSLDIDLVQLPSATLPDAGLHFTYQEYVPGAVISSRNSFSRTYMRGAFLRGTLRKPRIRTDIMIGGGSIQESDSDSQAGLLAVVDIHWMIVEPYCTFFMRVLANNRGAAPLFGVAIGYIN